MNRHYQNSWQQDKGQPTGVGLTETSLLSTSSQLKMYSYPLQHFIPNGLVNYTNMIFTSPSANVTQYSENSKQLTKEVQKYAREPIWKRRGTKPIPSLTLDPLIRCDGQLEHWTKVEPLLEIVNDKEWVIRGDHFEAHSLQDVADGVVINPPLFPGWYSTSTQKVVPAMLPISETVLLSKAIYFGYQPRTLVTNMGQAVSNYSIRLIHPKRRHFQEVLVLARVDQWEGLSAIFAATCLKFYKVNVSVYIHQDDGRRKTDEEIAFINAGGTVYRNLNDIKGRVFRVIIVALEGRQTVGQTILPMFGEWLQHAVAVFVNPPVIKCSYSSAMQVATGCTYHLTQKSAIFVPAFPKAYVTDGFIDTYVVDVGIIPEVYMAAGMEPFVFRNRNQCGVPTALVEPVQIRSKGSKIYFYSHGMLVQ